MSKYKIGSVQELQEPDNKLRMRKDIQVDSEEGNRMHIHFEFIDFPEMKELAKKLEAAIRREIKK